MRRAARPAARRQAAEAAAAAERPAGRFVVQVGAYTDRTLREVRAKVEKLGLKTYTQEVETPSGRRTRVRVGPFDSRSEAEAAAARLKAAGLPATVWCCDGRTRLDRLGLLAVLAVSVVVGLCAASCSR
jgi:DedD protein